MPRFQCTPELADYLKKKNRSILCLEVAQSNTSDIEIAEPYLRIINQEQADYLKGKKRYRSCPLVIDEHMEGAVLLAPYHLTMEDVVTFGRKKVFLFHFLTIDGVRL